MYTEDREPAENAQYWLFLKQNREQFIEDQKRLGYDVVIADDKVLQIDIDTETAMKHFDKSYKLFAPILGNHKPPVISPSKSGPPHFHISIYFEDGIYVWKRLALQAMFGSDLIREMLSAYRVETNDPYPILFLEKEK